MSEVWKFPLALASEQEVAMPDGAQILSVQTQRELPCVWAIVDPAAPRVARRFRVYGTGHRFDPAKLEYLGTVQTTGGAFVWHVFADWA